MITGPFYYFQTPSKNMSTRTRWSGIGYVMAKQLVSQIKENSYEVETDLMELAEKLYENDKECTHVAFDSKLSFVTI